MPYITSIEQITLQEGVIEVLQVRFGQVPGDLKSAIEDIEDGDCLKTLLKQAVTISSLGAFWQVLNQLNPIRYSELYSGQREWQRFEEEKPVSFAKTFEQIARQEDIIEALEIRFGEVPEALEVAIEKVEDGAHLKSLHREAITISSLAVFQQVLDRLNLSEADEDNLEES